MCHTSLASHGWNRLGCGLFTVVLNSGEDLTAEFYSSVLIKDMGLRFAAFLLSPRVVLVSVPYRPYRRHRGGVFSFCCANSRRTRVSFWGLTVLGPKCTWPPTWVVGSCDGCCGIVTRSRPVWASCIFCCSRGVCLADCPFSSDSPICRHICFENNFWRYSGFQWYLLSFCRFLFLMY